jgi:hypothetical protein
VLLSAEIRMASIDLCMRSLTRWSSQSKRLAIQENKSGRLAGRYANKQAGRQAGEDLPIMATHNCHSMIELQDACTTGRP